MEKILEKSMISKMSESWIVDDVSISSDDDTSWEIINPSDDEIPDFSFSDSGSEPEDGSVSIPISESPPKKIPKKLLILERYNYKYNHDSDYYDRDGDVDGEDDGDEYQSSDGLDDELVPRSVGDRFGRNRMRKLGKREYSKMAKSKKLSMMYNRPGCVHGKHGLGLKHSLI